MLARPHPPQRPPLVLVVDNLDWSYRALESALTPAGYAVMRGQSAIEGLERARKTPPDILFVNMHLPDGSGIGVCHTLRNEPAFGSDIPVIVTSRSLATREQRLASLEAGAWEFVAHPFDTSELLFKVAAFSRARIDIQQARDESLMDHITGLYSIRGLERRALELYSLAFRSGQALSCVVIAPTFGAESDQEPSGTDVETVENVIRDVAAALRRAGRVSDAIGRMGRTEFAILAPGTDAPGAVRLAERLAEVIRDTAKDRGVRREFHLRAGYETVTDLDQVPLEGPDLLERAAIALRRTRGNGDWIRRFEEDGTPPRISTIE